jgi:predicted amidohydrolase
VKVRVDERHVEPRLPWIGGDTATLPPVLLTNVIEMATLNGARVLGLDDVTGSITPGKRADVILVRQDDLNMASACDIESLSCVSRLRPTSTRNDGDGDDSPGGA